MLDQPRCGNTIQVCVSRSSFDLDKVEPPCVEANCTSKEFLVEWLDADGTDALDQRITALENENQSRQAQLEALTDAVAALGQQVPGCLSEEAGDAIFTGCDVESRNGLGNTETTNGSGNLIVGYNEGDTSSQTRSHNMVGGTNSEHQRRQLQCPPLVTMPFARLPHVRPSRGVRSIGGAGLRHSCNGSRRRLPRVDGAAIHVIKPEEKCREDRHAGGWPRPGL